MKKIIEITLLAALTVFILARPPKPHPFGVDPDCGPNPPPPGVGCFHK